jgi:hypothetical protein
MLSGVPSLEVIDFCDCEELEGSIGSLRVLKDTLRSVDIYDNCGNISGDIMELSDFSKLKRLILDGSSVTGDVRNLRVHHFPALCAISLPQTVYGGKIIELIGHASEIMVSLSPLQRRTPELFKGYRWSLSKSSPDYYPSDPEYGAPLNVGYVMEGISIGWRWSSGNADSDFLGGYWDGHCDTIWIDPDSYDDAVNEVVYAPFRNIVENCSSHLLHGYLGCSVNAFAGFHEPPSEEQYREAINIGKRTKEIIQTISNPIVDLIEILEEVVPRYRSFGHECRANNGRINDEHSETHQEAAASESEEDSMSDLIDFGIDDIHTTSDPDRQINIIGTYVLSDHNKDPKLTWRALWSMEEQHDMWLGGIRTKLFHRWPRESAPSDDPYRDEHSNAIFFPGISASHDAKCAWAGMVVEECAANNMRPAFDMSWERDFSIPTLDEAPSVISDILLACAPNQLSVCLYIDRSMIEGFITCATVQEKEATGCKFEKANAGLENIKKFLSSPYIRDDAPSQIKLNDDGDMSDQAAAEKLKLFKQWLKEDATSGGTPHQEEVTEKLPPRRYDSLATPLSNLRLHRTRAKDLVLLARRDNVTKGTSTEDVLHEMMSSLGLYEDLVYLDQTSSRNPDIHGYSYITSDLIGGNVHYPDLGGRTSVAFTWTSTTMLTREHIQKKQYLLAFETAFVRDANSTKEASNGRLCFILWPRASDSDRGGLTGSFWPHTNGSDFPLDTTAVTSNNAHVIWLPGDYEKIEEKIFNHCINGNNSPMRFSTTHTGNIFWQTVVAYLQKVIVKGRHSYLEEHMTIPNNHSLRLCLLLGITRALIESDDSFCNTEHDEKKVIKEFFELLSNQWRSVLLKSDVILGLGSEGTLTRVPRVTD